MSNKRNLRKLKIDTNYIENCSEVELFVQIQKYYTFLEQLKLVDYYHKMDDLYQKQEDLKLANYFKRLENCLLDRMPNEDELKELEDTLDFCLLQTTRFHTGIHDNPNGRIQITPDFENWYYSWVNYFDKMDADIYEIYRRCCYEGKGLEQFKLNQSLSVTVDEDENTLNGPKVKQYHYQDTNKNIRQRLA